MSTGRVPDLGKVSDFHDKSWGRDGIRRGPGVPETVTEVASCSSKKVKAVPGPDGFLEFSPGERNRLRDEVTLMEKVIGPSCLNIGVVRSIFE